MDFLEDPEIKAKYDKCKLTVKIWEHQFIKKYKRVPSKLDIREAPTEVRHSYRKYFQLKTAALEQSFMDIEGFENEQETTSQSLESEDSMQGFIYSTSQNSTEVPSTQDSTQEDNSELLKKLQEIHGESKDPKLESSEKEPAVWGSHLNIGKSTEDKVEKSQNTSINSITNKLFSGSKFNKRNPRKSLGKSLSFAHKTKSDNAIDSPQFYSQPTLENENSFLSQETSNPYELSGNKMSAEVAALTHRSFSQSVSINPINNPENRLSSSLRNVDRGWLQRVAQNTGFNFDKSSCDSTFNNVVKTKLDFSSDSDIVESSDDEQTRTPLSIHVAKKLRLSYSSNNLIQSSQSYGNGSSVKNIESNSLVSNTVNQINNILAKPSEGNSNLVNNIDDKDSNQGENSENLTLQLNVEKSPNDPVKEPQSLEFTHEEHLLKESLKSAHENLDKSVKSDIENSLDDAVKEPTPLEDTHEVTSLKVVPLESAYKNDKFKVLNTLSENPDDSTSKTETPKKPGRKTKQKNEIEPLKSAKKSQNLKKSKTPKKYLQSEDEDTASPRRSSRQNKTKISFEELNSSEEDPFHSDNDERDPEFTVEKESVSRDKSEELGEEVDKSPIIKRKTPKTVKKSKTEKTPKAVKTLKAVKTPKIAKGRKVGGVNFLMKSKRKTNDNEQKTEDEDINTHQKYELEYSVKSRVVAPRYSSIVKVLTEKSQNNKRNSNPTPKNNEDKNSTLPTINPKRSEAREKLERKIAAGQLNENFVTIDIKKKVFVKGKSKYNFSKYKKSQWKAKKKALYGPDMDMSGCDGGKLKCFKCGQEGHFAFRCQNGKGDELLPMAVEEECEIPSLEEAKEMAFNSKLSVRKPKLQMGVKNDTENVEESDNEYDFDDNIDEVLLAEAIKLEEYVNKLDASGYVDNLKTVPAYFAVDNDISEKQKEIFQALKQFGHTSFRDGQEKAIMRILEGKSTLVTLATGTGKSLCYQLPAHLYAQRGGERSITLVISPLVSLMEDQVVGVPTFLKAACLHTNQTATNREKIIEALEANELDILLISPEAIVAGEKQTGFRSLFRKLPPIAFACIDEVHCISQWSHNFRPSYLMVSRVLRESLGVKTILGLTATATRATCENIIDLLGIPDGLEGIIKDTPLPDNLHLTVSKDAARDRALLNLLTSDKFKDLKSIIVYCTRRDECERIASFLRTSFKDTVFESDRPQKNKRKRFNIQAEPYHAGMSGSRRRTVQNAFMSGDLRIVVATVAFGMGINKSDIRAVIHFNMPNSFESYVQEVGRAGRDGLPAYCHVFLDSQGRDESELRRHIHSNSIDRHVIRKFTQKVFVPCSCKGTCPKHEVAFSIEECVRALDIPEENITTLLCYLELHKNKYAELLSPAYTTCKVVSYGGLNHIKKAAKDCPPLAMALAMYHSKDEKDNILEFPVVDVASAIGWDSGICKHKLKNLEWTSENNIPKRSCLSVKFSNLGIRFLAPGNLQEDQLDEALDNLYKIVVNQQEKARKQLTAVHKTLIGVAEKSYRECVSLEKSDNNELKMKIREYFGSADPLADVTLESSKEINEDQLINDVRAMISMYRDNQFTDTRLYGDLGLYCLENIYLDTGFATMDKQNDYQFLRFIYTQCPNENETKAFSGRAIARIFHGIQSPNYPAVMWGRCKFWRSHLHEDFHEICRIATKEIIKFR